jgi:ABC-2 type transport system permease protein
MYLFTLGALNFWTTRTSALFELSIAIELLMSGRLVPLSLMPEWIQRASLFLPYRWTFLFPIEAMIGRLSSSEIVVGLLAQIGWVAVLALLIKLVWGRAIKRYTAVGG